MALLFRYRIGSSGIDEAYRKMSQNVNLHFHISTINGDEQRLLQLELFGSHALQLLFCAPQAVYGVFAIPDDILAVARRETVPCGVMVLYGIMADEEVQLGEHQRQPGRSIRTTR